MKPTKGYETGEMTRYEEVSKIYLGPATEKFIALQCELLRKDAHDLAATDWPALPRVDGSRRAGLVMDQKKAKELGLKVKAL